MSPTGEELSTMAAIVALTAATVKALKEAGTPGIPHIPLLFQVIIFSTIYTCLAVWLGLLPMEMKPAIAAAVFQALSAAGLFDNGILKPTAKKESIDEEDSDGGHGDYHLRG